VLVVGGVDIDEVKSEYYDFRGKKIVVDGLNIIKSFNGGKKITLHDLGTNLAIICGQLRTIFKNNEIVVCLKNIYFNDNDIPPFNNIVNETGRLRLPSEVVSIIVLVNRLTKNILFRIAVDNNNYTDKEHHLAARDDYVALMEGKNNIILSKDNYNDKSTFGEIRKFMCYDVINDTNEGKIFVTREELEPVSKHMENLVYDKVTFDWYEETLYNRNKLNKIGKYRGVYHLAIKNIPDKNKKLDKKVNKIESSVNSDNVINLNNPS
jgi:hypothetical protein